MKKVIIKKETYFDSVFLMQVDRKFKQIPGIIQSVVAMATPHNKEILKNLDFSSDKLSETTSNDLVIAIEAEKDEVFKRAVNQFEEIIKKHKMAGSAGRRKSFATFNSALKELPEASLALISIPGQYVAAEAKKCLEKGLNVMIFSDNVSLENEIELKNEAAEKGLLVMGPDCGTAIINHVPLAFANVVKPGPIGIVGASGTGTQEITCLIDSFGGGITQAIGTGGRDLSEKVGGITSLLAIDLLVEDDKTKVIIVISKPPANSIAKKIIAKLKTSGKPCVVHFLGHKTGKKEEGSVIFASSLFETASLACKLSGMEAAIQEMNVVEQAKKSAEKISGKRKFIRGLFTGGTLCDEAIMVFEDNGINVYSNIHHDANFKLLDQMKSSEHSFLDLGDDTFTVGRPHPMIDPSTRTDRIEAELSDPEVAVLLFDVVLGYGSHPDPAGALAEAIGKDCPCVVVASITGTEGDYQNYDIQKQILLDAGIIIMPSNYHAALCGAEIIKIIGKT